MDEPETEVSLVTKALFHSVQANNIDDVRKHLRTLCSLCNNADNQITLAENTKLQNYLHDAILSADVKYTRLRLLAWGLLMSICSRNGKAQNIVWSRHGAHILNKCGVSPLDDSTKYQLNFLYNMYCADPKLLTDAQALPMVVRTWQSIITEKCTLDFEYLHFFFEQFLVRGGRATVQCYSKLTQQQRIGFLDYISSYLQQGNPNGLIHDFLLQHISKEFRLKSDTVLRHASTEQQKINGELHPREVHSLLEVIASATGYECYGKNYATDHALFINVSSLLRCMVAAGKQPNVNIFTPLNKLEEVAPASSNPRDFETEISFELKTLLVRCCANLLYANKTNQAYCLDTELMPALFECTNMDARNPLVKEWSILAIRNACINCAEAQLVIQNLTKQTAAPNDILKELNLELGSLRIQPNKD